MAVMPKGHSMTLTVSAAAYETINHNATAQADTGWIRMDGILAACYFSPILRPAEGDKGDTGEWDSNECGISSGTSPLVPTQFCMAETSWVHGLLRCAWACIFPGG